MIFEEISQLVAADKTAAEIAATLAADRRTVNAIPLNALMHILNVRGMLSRRVRPADTGEKWQGSMVAMMMAVDSVGTPAQQAAVTQWFSHITNGRNQTFDTTDAGFAVSFDLMRQLFADQPGMPTSDDFAAVIELGGGYRFEGVEASQIQLLVDEESERLESEALALRADAWQVRFDKAVNTIGTAKQTEGVADLRAIANEIEASS